MQVRWLRPDQQRGSECYIPDEDRIAVFDMDGTLITRTTESRWGMLKRNSKLARTLHRAEGRLELTDPRLKWKLILESNGSTRYQDVKELPQGLRQKLNREKTIMKIKNKKLFHLFLLVITISLLMGRSVFADKPKILVAYFSATGTTRAAAKKIRKATGGKLYQIRPIKAYTSSDLDYDNDGCRATVEQRDPSARPEVKGTVKGIKKYDVIFIGYPIWWGKEPKVIKTFLESYQLSGNTIIPFCTSGSSGISGSINGIKESALGARVKTGKDLTGLSYQQVEKWAKSVLK